MVSGVDIVMVVYLIIEVGDFFNLNVVKVVCCVDGDVVYFLWVLIFYVCDYFVCENGGEMLFVSFLVYCYVGLYVYWVSFLKVYVGLSVVLIE